MQPLLARRAALRELPLASSAEAAAALLAARGLLLVGLDVIGDSLTEVNVTSPTCFREITEQTGFDVAQAFLVALERAVKDPP
jgi:glutathione synthase